MAEIPVDQNALNANAPYSKLEPLNKNDVVQFLSDFYGWEAVRRQESFAETSGRQGIIEGGIRLLTPAPQRIRKNSQWKILEKIVDLLPKDYLRGVKTDQGVENNALIVVDLAPYFDAVEPTLSSDEKQVLDGLRTTYIETRADPVFADVINETTSGAGAPNETTAGVPESAPSDNEMFDPTKAGSGTAGIPGTAPPFGALRQDLNVSTQAIMDQPFSLTDLPGSKTFPQEYQRQRLDWMESQGMADPQVDLPLIDSLTGAQALEYIYTLNRRDVMAIQRMLGRAGYFNETGAAYSTLGTVDDNTKKAWDTMLLDAGRRRMPVSELLRTRIESYPQEANIQYSDPLAWEQAAETFAANVLNRSLTGQEIQSFLRAVRTWERDAALGPSVTGEPQVDVEAQAQAYFDEQFMLERARNVTKNFTTRFIRGVRIES